MGPVGRDNVWKPSQLAVRNEDTFPVDRNTTASIAGSDASGLNTLGNPDPAGSCASSTSGPDAVAGQKVNDQYCGK